MSFWVYENWRAHGRLSRVHRAECRQCNDGQGVAGGTRADNGAWHGRFATFAAAQNASLDLAGPTYYCKICRLST